SATEVPDSRISLFTASSSGLGSTTFSLRFNPATAAQSAAWSTTDEAAPRKTATRRPSALPDGPTDDAHAGLRRSTASPPSPPTPTAASPSPSPARSQALQGPRQRSLVPRWQTHLPPSTDLAVRAKARAVDESRPAGILSDNKAAGVAGERLPGVSGRGSGSAALQR